MGRLQQLIGSFKYTLLRLRERITGAGPGVPEVPVIPSPTEPGELQVVGPPRGSARPRAAGVGAARAYRAAARYPLGGPTARVGARSSSVVTTVECITRGGPTMISAAATGSSHSFATVTGSDPGCRRSALVLVLVVASAYLLFIALRLNPFASNYRVTIALPDSGGLLRNQDAAVRGFRVGRVDALHLTPDGVNAVVHLDSKFPIPANSAVRVSGLSPAGEQYVDFLPDTTEGPFLKDGSVIEKGRAVVPMSLADTLTNADGALKQLDTAKLDIMKKELSMSKEGPQKLADIVDGGTFLLTTLDSVLPETTSLLKNTRVVLNLGADKSAGIGVAAESLDKSFAGINKMLERLPHAQRGDAEGVGIGRQSVHRQLRHHGAAAGEPHHHVQITVSAGAGTACAVPRLPHVGVRRDRQHHARQWPVGDR